VQAGRLGFDRFGKKMLGCRNAGNLIYVVIPACFSSQILRRVFSARTGLRKAAALSLILSGLAQARVIHVMAGGDEDFVSQGASWDQPANLHHAIEISSSGDQIWVGSGTYLSRRMLPSGLFSSLLLKEGVAIYGGFQGTESQFSERDLEGAAPTILTGDLEDDDLAIEDAPWIEDTMVGRNTDCVVKAYGVGRTTVLDGVTITGAKGTYSASALEIRGGSPIINACRFLRNFSQLGGAISVRNESSPIISNCLIRHNEADESGGGVYCELSSPMIVNCTFLDNLNDAGDGNLTIYAERLSGVTVQNSIIWNRHALEGDRLPVGTSGASYCFCSHNLMENSDTWDQAEVIDGGGNLPVRPGFIGGRLRLRVDSPGVAHGLGIFVPEDQADFDDDGVLDERLSRDLSGRLYEPILGTGRVTVGCFQYHWSDDSDLDGLTDRLERRVTGDSLGLSLPLLTLEMRQSESPELMMTFHRDLGDFADFQLQRGFYRKGSLEWEDSDLQRYFGAIEGNQVIRRFRLVDGARTGFYRVRVEER
jgi:hypothetical protein